MHWLIERIDGRRVVPQLGLLERVHHVRDRLIQSRQQSAELGAGGGGRRQHPRLYFRGRGRSELRT